LQCFDQAIEARIGKQVLALAHRAGGRGRGGDGEDGAPGSEAIAGRFGY
jgi:hypothetical protein